ncbi:MAG: hypothetical protein H6988_12495 [Pseudomonadales bacterium]|nr:hypothetical protein [Pseudomonadales bacterium]
MKQGRDAAAARLGRIKAKLEAVSPLSLTDAERTLLANAISRALEGEQNPFAIPLGKASKAGRDRAIAMHILMARRSGEAGTDTEAIQQAAERFGVGGGDGGTAEKAWNRHRKEAEGVFALYAARNEGRAMTDDEIRAFEQALGTIFPD